jgi:hypothetical protein
MVVYDDGVMIKQCVTERCRVFENGRKDVHGDDITGQPSTSGAAVKAVRRDELVLENQRVTHF